MRRSFLARVLLVVAVSCCGIESVPAQPQTTDADIAISLGADLIHAKLQAAESSTAFNDAQRGPIVDTYKQILAELEKKNALRATIAKFVQDTAEIPKRIADMKAEIAAVPQETALDADTLRALREIEAKLPDGKVEVESWLTLASATLKQMEVKFGAQRTELDVVRKQLDALKGELKNRADRRLRIPQDIAAANERIELRKKEAGQPPNADEPAELIQARRLLILARQETVRLEIERNTRELAFYDPAGELLSLRHDLAQRTFVRLEQSVKLWGQAVDRLRKRIVDQQARSAASKAMDVANELSELNDIAAANVGIANTRTKLGAKIKADRALLAKTTKRLEVLNDEFDRLQRQVGDRATVTQAVGERLRKNRQELPNVGELRAASKDRKDALYEIRLTQIENDEKLWEFNDLDAKVQSELAKLAKAVSAKRLKTLKPELTDLLEAQQLSLVGLKNDLSAHLDILTNLDVQADALIALTEEYASFVDQRVLWIRSIPPISVGDIPDLAKSVSWLLSASSWSALGQSLLVRLERAPVLNALAVFVFLGLFGYRARHRRRIPQLGEQAESGTCRNFRITLDVALYSILRAAMWPAVLAWLAWNFYKLPDSTVLARPVAVALHVSVRILFPLALWLRILHSRGLAESHFGWSEHNLKVLRRELRWFVPIFVPAIALFQVFSVTDNLVYDKSAARLFFLIATTALAVFMQRLLSPHAGLLKEYIGTHRGGWINQLRFLWHPLLVSIPLAFAVLSLLGYQYTASQLVRRFYMSAAFLSGMYLVSAVFSRWIKISRRSLAIEQARDRLAALSLSEEIEKPPSDSLGGVTVSDNVDLSAVNLQSRRMLSSFSIAIALMGLYFIWVGVLPALAKLDEVKLWRTTAPVQSSAVSFEQSKTTGTSTALTPSAYPPPTQYQWVTLANLIGTLVIVILTVIATQNIPGLMEIALLQRLPLDASLRYAITTVTRYVIMVVGAAWALGNIGIGWGKIQWLVAAVSVGLGFGLQEIFANFVSGLILLFERPLRAGDIVTVGDVTGQVVQIKTRATTIEDWDHKELIVPNKEFIMGRVLNWTLSDTVNRIVIVVGIAYGSNLKEARRIILKVAEDHPLIVDDPVPSVTFELFGDSTLNFTLRNFILLSNIDKRLAVVHELNEAIHDRLHEAGIDIAFPQRDLHIRSVDVPFAISPPHQGEHRTNSESESASAPVQNQESRRVGGRSPKEK